MKKVVYELAHGIPSHNYFAIFQPCYSAGGLDISCVPLGIDMEWTLKNPFDRTESKATLVARGTLLTDWPYFEALSVAIYGVSGKDVIASMKLRYPEMVDGYVELWTFRK